MNQGVFDRATVSTDSVVPNISILQRLKLVGEYGKVRKELMTGDLGMVTKLTKARRLNELRGLLIGQKTPAPLKDAPEPIPVDETNITRLETSNLYTYNPERKQAERRKANKGALKLLSEVGDEVSLTDEQKRALTAYSGNGGAIIGADGKKGSVYEYYTPKPIAENMWALLEELGFSGGKILDPCAGVGIFGATAPKNAVVDSVELDETSGRINKLVNQGPGYSATIAAFEEVAARTPDEQYDAVVSNVPFGKVSDRGGNQFKDPKYQKEPLQNYFILRSLEKLKPNGLAAFIVPPRCVSGKGGTEEKLRIRASLMAEFVGGYRLPNSVFGTAQADTITDVIVFRKYSQENREKIQELRDQDSPILIESNVLWQEFIDGDYFKKTGKRYVLGEFVAKDPNKIRDVDRVINDGSVSDIAKLMRKFGGSHINWDLLEASETLPIVYNDGDTIIQSGMTLQYQDGAWVGIESQARDMDVFTSGIISSLKTAEQAIEKGLSFSDVAKAVTHMQVTGQSLEIPAWVLQAKKQIDGIESENEKAICWLAGITGIAIDEVMTTHKDEVLNYLEEYPKISAYMASYARTKVSLSSGIMKDGIKKIDAFYTKKDGYSAVWRGDVGSLVQDHTVDELFEAEKYANGGFAVSIETAKKIYGEEFDPIADEDWCISQDGTLVTKADDYYVGNVGKLLSQLDAQIKTTENEVIKGKLLRMKQAALTRTVPINISGLSFTLPTPLVTHQEKATFLRAFVHPSADIVYDEFTGKARVDILTKGSTLNEKLLNRVGDYLKNGTVTLGGLDTLKFGVSEEKALQALRGMIEKANAQFNAWVKSNPEIMARLESKANDPQGLYFQQADDESPLEIKGLSKEWNLHGYQNAFVRRMTREFSGINGFDVGLGKTITALATVQYMQNIGVKKKTLFAVPNSVLSNWHKESVVGEGVKGETGYKAPAYDSAEGCLFVGLTVDKSGRAKVDSKDYDRDLVKILENRHSKVFMSMEAFERIRLREETAQKYDAYLASIDSSYAESDIKRKDEQSKSRRTGLIEIISASGRGKSAVAPYFEDMGFDSIVIDEAHAFKNSKEINEFKGGKFLSLAPASVRGLDAQAKTWYIRGTSPKGDGVLGLTATPITNSPLEIYSMLSLTAGEKRVNDTMLGCKGADDFMNTMCVIESMDELSIDDQVKSYNVFTGLRNVDILRQGLLDIAVIKSASDVGASVALPTAEEESLSISLPKETTEQLIEYKQAYQIANKLIKKDVVDAEERELFERIAEKFGEKMELIAHPFNLINKMTLLITDPDLDKRATIFQISDSQVDKAQEVIKSFNDKKIIDERPRLSEYTTEEAQVGIKRIKDGDNETVLLRIHVMAQLIGDKIVLDSINPKVQDTFDKMIDDAGLNVSVSIPPKIAALLENVKLEKAHPRGMNEGGASKHVKQIIFCDVLSLHAKIRRLLVSEAGVPPGKIVIITGQNNGKPEEIQEVQNGFNADGADNKYENILANEKAEVGINLQKGTQAIHHLTVGWTPDSLTQRNGRGVRQGNKTKKVNIYHYDADGTFDNYKRSLVSKKADWIATVLDRNGASEVAIGGGLTREQQDLLIGSVGDTNAMDKIREASEANAKAAAIATTQREQSIYLQTAQASISQNERFDSAAKWVGRAVADYHKAVLQLNKTTARFNSPKVKESSLPRIKEIMEGDQARVDALKEQIEACATFENSYGGDEHTIGIVLGNILGNIPRGTTPDERIMSELSNSQYKRYKITVKENTPLFNEWQANFNMNEKLVEKSKAEFAKLGKKEGAIPEELLEAALNGDASITEGKLLAEGVLIQKDGLYGICKSGSQIYVFNQGEVSGRYKSVSKVDVMDADFHVFYPGSKEYQDGINWLAKNEDEYFSNKDNPMLSKDRHYVLASELSNDVLNSKKIAATVKTGISGYLLPAPYFPVVLDGSKQGEYPVSAHIAKEQSAVVIAINKDEGYFVHDADLDVTKDFRFDAVMPLIDYLRAHNLKISKKEFELITWENRLFEGISFEGVTKVQEAIQVAGSESEIDELILNWLADSIDYVQSSDLTIENFILSKLGGRYSPVFNGYESVKRLRITRINELEKAAQKALAEPEAGETVEVQEASIELEPEPTPAAQEGYVYVVGDTYRFNKEISFREVAAKIGLEVGFVGSKGVKARDKDVCAKLPEAAVNSWVMPVKLFDHLMANYPTLMDKHNVSIGG